MPLGASLLAVEAELVGEAMEDVFGWELLQVGAWGAPGSSWRGAVPAARVSWPPPEFPGGRRHHRARRRSCRSSSDSIDAALLPHTLEFAADPYAIVREVDRVLAAEGQLLVLGFRPLSLWGLRARASRNGFPPGMRRVLSGEPGARVAGASGL